MNQKVLDFNQALDLLRAKANLLSLRELTVRWGEGNETLGKIEAYLDQFAIPAAAAWSGECLGNQWRGMQATKEAS